MTKEALSQGFRLIEEMEYLNLAILELNEAIDSGDIKIYFSANGKNFELPKAAMVEAKRAYDKAYAKLEDQFKKL